MGKAERRSFRWQRTMAFVRCRTGLKRGSAGYAVITVPVSPSLLADYHDFANAFHTSLPASHVASMVMRLSVAGLMGSWPLSRRDRTMPKQRSETPYNAQLCLGCLAGTAHSSAARGAGESWACLRGFEQHLLNRSQATSCLWRPFTRSGLVRLCISAWRFELCRVMWQD